MPIKKGKLDAINGYREYQARKKQEQEEARKVSSSPASTAGKKDQGITKATGQSASGGSGKKATIRKEKLDAIPQYREAQSRQAAQAGGKRTGYLETARNATQKNIQNPVTSSAEDIQSRITELEKQGARLNSFIRGAMNGAPREQVKSFQDELSNVNRELSSLRSDLELAKQGSTISRLDQLNRQLSEARTEESAAQAAVNKLTGGKPYGYMPADPSELSAAYTALNTAKSARKKIESQIEQIEYLNKYQDKTYEDNFAGQFAANYNVGRMGQDSSLAWNDYLMNPTDENRARAEAIDELITQFQLNNEETLADDGTLPWLSKSLANYIPQFADQLKYQAGGAAAGALGGSLIPGAGTVAGAKAGAVAGSGLYSYQTMRGAAYSGLLDLGVDPEIARAASNDEAVISSLIEMADTGLDIATLGVGKLLKSLGKTGVKAVAGKSAQSAGKKLLKALAGYGLNIAGEMLEEGTQEAVSIANENRVVTGPGDSGTFGLAKDAAGVFYNAVRGDENTDRVWEASKEGGKIAAMMGGATALTTNLANTAVERANNRRLSNLGTSYQADPQAVIDEGLSFSPDTEAYQTASELKAKVDAGETLTDADVGRAVVANERAIRREQANAAPAEAPETLEDAAREVVAQREKTAKSAASEATGHVQNVPYNVMIDENPVRQQKVNAEKLVKKMTGYGEYGTRAIMDVMEQENVTLEQAKAQFQTAYEAGMTDMPVAKANLTSDLQRIAFNAGKQDYIMSMKKDTENAKYATVYGKESGFIPTDAAQGVSQSTKDTLNTISMALGIKSRYVESITRSDGREANASMSGDGILSISRSAEKPDYVLVAHESTHRMQQLAPKEYRAFRDFAVQSSGWLEGRLESGVMATTEVEQMQKDYGGISTDEAMDEIAAEFAEKLFTDEDALRAAINEANKTPEHRTAMQKFFDTVRDVVKKLKQAIAKLRGKADVTELENTISDLERARGLWLEAYHAAEKNAQETKNTAQTDGVKYSLNAEFTRELDAWIQAGKKGGGYFRIGTTSEALQSIGVKDYAIYWDKTKIAKIMKSHPEMTQDIIAQVPNILEHPVIVMQSNTVANRIMVYGELMTADNVPVMAALELRPQNKRGEILDFSKIASAYGREQIQNDINTSDILYLDPNKKRTNTWLEALRLQLPAGLTKYGSISMVTYANRDVNGNLTFGESGKTSMQAAFEKAMEQGTFSDNVSYSLKVTDKDTLDFLDKQKTITTYKTMQLIDGKLYPPMAARIDGTYEDASVLGAWEQSTEHPELIRNGNKFKLDKGKGQGSIEAAYNPYMHSSNLVLNDQFSGAYKRDNLFTIECEVPVSELTSGYHAQYAKDSVGWHAWHTGTVAGSLRKQTGVERKVFLSRWIKPVRIVPDAEVAAMYKELLDGTDVAVPDNVVTPSLLAELKKAGVKIKESGRLKELETAGAKYSLKQDSAGRTLTEQQQEYFKDSKAVDENGNLLVMYHGTAKGGFTEFRDWAYLTADRKYAERYTDHNTGKTMYEVYANIKNPFDTRLKKCRDLFNREFQGNYSNTPLQESGLPDWTDGYDLVDWIEENGYDYDAVLLDEGADPTADGVKERGISYVVRSSEQIKNVTNENPTKSRDIRFSLKSPVEETKDLIALHNMHESKLRNTLKLGAWPSPSIAIVQAKQGHSDYGAYTAVFRRSTIDPEADSRNKVYGSDAWTPTGSNARVEYEVDYPTMRSIEKKVSELSKKVAGGIFDKSGVLGMLGIEDVTDMTADDIARRLANYDAVRAAYLADQGGNVEPVYRKKTFDSFGNDILQAYIDSVGVQKLASIIADMETSGGDLAIAERELESVRDVVIGEWVRKNEFRLKNKPELRETRIANQREKLTAPRAESFIRNAWEFYEDSGATTDEIDRMATSDELRAAVSEQDVIDWIRPQIDGMLGEPGIYNGKDRIDRYGHSRSFAETHYTYTAENIVKAMNAASARGEGMMGGAGATGLVATATPSYKNIKEIRADKGRLGKVDEAEYKRLLKELDGDLDQVIAEIMRKTEHHASNQYEEETIIGYVLEKAATGKHTIDAIVKQFRAEDYKISNETAKHIQAVFKKAAEMPTGYFEAKPQRVVPFDEAVAILAPSDAPADLIAEMRDKGIKVITYEQGNDAQRLEILNGLEDVRFSLKKQNDLMKENSKLKETVDGLREQFKVTTFAQVDKKSLDNFTKQLLKDYESGAEINDTREALADLYGYMANGEDGQAPVWNEVYKRAYDVAVSVLENASTLDDSLWQEYKPLRDELRTRGLTLDRQYTSDLAGYESIEDFRKAHFGKIKMVNNGTPVDVAYADLAMRYPEFFDETAHTNPADQLLDISETLERLQPVEVNPYSYNMRESATWLANDIIERFYDLPQAKPTFADKANQKLTKQVIKDAKKMERMRYQKNERIKALIEENREKVRAVQAKEREKRAEAVQGVKEHYKAKDAKTSESRKARELRAKIMRHAQDLSTKLLRPTDKQHIPQQLQGAVAELLSSINLESNYTMDPETQTYKKSDDGLPTRRTKAFTELKQVYQDLANSLVIDPDLMGDDGLLSDVIAMADKRIVDMNRAELETVWQTVRAVEATVMTANKAFSKSKWASISEAAEGLREDNRGKSLKTEYRGGLGKMQKLTGLDMMTPETYMHLLGESGDGIFRVIRDAQDAHIRKMAEVSDFTHEKLKNVNVNKLENDMHTVTLGGEDVKLSTAQLMELYVLMRRQQAQDHILTGGILPDVVSAKGIKKITRAEPVRGITIQEIGKALSVLTDEQKKTAEALQSFASTTLSKWGNEASMQVYNYEKFNEPVYWPIRTNRQEISSDVSKDTAVTTVAGRGFTKQTKPNANTSVRLGSIFDTFATHSSEMATYAAWLGATEDINRIRNYQFMDKAGNRTGTVKGIIERVHGTQGTAYLNKLLSDISNGVKGTHAETQFMSGIVGNYKAAAVGANLRVIIQQPTAILRAMDMIGPQYLVAGMKPSGGWKKAVKYAPIAQWKDWGYFDINTGRQMKDVLFDSDDVLNKVKNVSMWGAGKADSISWGLLWNACEAETKAKRADLKAGTDAYYQAVAERFTEIVDHTQVVDGIVQRSQIMRSADGLTKMATSFMGEPTKQYNMFLSAAYDAKHVKSANTKKRLARSAVTLVVSGVVNAMAQSVMDAVRDDDKEKKYWEKWLNAMIGFEGDEDTAKDYWDAFWAGNLGNTFNPATYIPYLKDIVSIIQGYDVSRMDMESVEKTISAAQNMIKALNGDGKYTIGAASANLFAEAARMIGVPVANLKRDVKSIAMTYAIQTDNYLMQYRMEKASLDLNYSLNGSTFMDILYNAYVNDQDAYELIYADMVASGYDTEKLANAMESRMKKAAGVKKVSELESRYLIPDQQKAYDSKMKPIQSSSLWKKASEEQRDALENDLYNIVTGSDAGLEMQEKIADGAPYGLDETEYLLYQLAKDMYDTPNKSGEYGGTPTNEEKADAILSIPGLGNSEMAYLWDSDDGYEAYAAGIDMEKFIQYRGDGGKTGVEKIIDAKNAGIEEDTYFEFLDMLKAVDQPTESGKYGSYTQAEAAEAIRNMPGLSNAERAYLWQSVNKSWKANKNPWG